MEINHFTHILNVFQERLRYIQDENFEGIYTCPLSLALNCVYTCEYQIVMCLMVCFMCTGADISTCCIVHAVLKKIICGLSAVLHESDQILASFKSTIPFSWYG